MPLSPVAVMRCNTASPSGDELKTGGSTRYRSRVQEHGGVPQGMPDLHDTAVAPAVEVDADLTDHVPFTLRTRRLVAIPPLPTF